MAKVTRKRAKRGEGEKLRYDILEVADRLLLEAGSAFMRRHRNDRDFALVSEVAGTTRDSVDVRFERDGKVYLAIDTAGVRKKKSLGLTLVVRF